jgi:hypothetical protein
MGLRGAAPDGIRALRLMAGGGAGGTSGGAWAPIPAGAGDVDPRMLRLDGLDGPPPGDDPPTSLAAAAARGSETTAAIARPAGTASAGLVPDTRRDRGSGGRWKKLVASPAAAMPISSK